MDEDDFLAAVEADNSTVPVEEAKAEPKSEPAPLELTEEAPPEPAKTETAPANPFVPPVVDTKPEPGFVPITSMLDERDKRQKLEAELAQIRASQQQQQPQAIPDVFEDPEGFQAYQAQTTLNAKLDISEEMARDKFGDEAVDAARDWALQQSQERPGFYQELIQQRNPYRYAVEQYRREQIASQVSPDDFTQFQAWKAAQTALNAPLQPQAAADPPASRSLPPRSLASAPSAGGVMTEIVQSDAEAFEEIMPKR